MPLKYVLQCRYFKVGSRGYVFLKARIYLTYFFYLIIFMYNVVQCKIILVFIWMRKKAIKKIRIIKKLFKNLPRKSLLTIHKSLFFSLRIFFHGHWQLLGQQGKGVAHLLIATLVFTRLLLDEIYHHIELLFDWLIMWCWFSFAYLFILILGFVTAIWHEKPVDSSSHRLSSL